MNNELKLPEKPLFDSLRWVVWKNEHHAGYSLSILGILNLAYPREPINFVFLVSLFHSITGRIVGACTTTRRSASPVGNFEFKVLGVGMIAAEMS